MGKKLEKFENYEYHNLNNSSQNLESRRLL